MADYIISGFWPPVPDKITFLVCSNLLTMWYHLKLLTPGTSERKFLECLSAMSTEGSRVNSSILYVLLSQNNPRLFSSVQQLMAPCLPKPARPMSLRGIWLTHALRTWINFCVEFVLIQIPGSLLFSLAILMEITSLPGLTAKTSRQNI